MKKIFLIFTLVTLLLGGEFEQRGNMLYDTKTHLSWQSKPSSKKMSWSSAKAHCKSLGLRLPNIYELKSLVDYSQFNPAIRSSLIEIRTDDWYWSSTVDPDDSSLVWNVAFKRGNDRWYGKSGNGYALCVQ